VKTIRAPFGDQFGSRPLGIEESPQPHTRSAPAAPWRETAEKDATDARTSKQSLDIAAQHHDGL
jgi:hypothetical protein